MKNQAKKHYGSDAKPLTAAVSAALIAGAALPAMSQDTSLVRVLFYTS